MGCTRYRYVYAVCLYVDDRPKTEGSEFSGELISRRMASLFFVVLGTMAEVMRTREEEE